jgi:hypothetical protein
MQYMYRFRTVQIRNRIEHVTTSTVIHISSSLVNGTFSPDSYLDIQMISADTNNTIDTTSRIPLTMYRLKFLKINAVRSRM